MLRPLSPEGLRQIPVARPAIPHATDLIASRMAMSPPADGEKTQLRQACQDFEAIFVSYLLRRMRATVPESGFLSDSREQRLFRDLLDEQLAARLAASGKTGLAEIIYRQVTSRLQRPRVNGGDTDPAQPLKPQAGPAENVK